MEQKGFQSFSNIPLAFSVWAVVLFSTFLFLSLEWNFLSIALLEVPLIVVVVFVTVAAARNAK